MPLPERFQSLLWDVDFATIDEERYASQVIGRFLEHGTIDELRWLLERYGWERIRRFMREDGHRLAPRSASLWARVFEAEPEKPRRPQHIPWPP